ncbi:MAG: hypothetical protein J6Z13_05785 [Clostridia bacterium]|nr:hypothetical protein [Clostridia bacterium]
MIQITVIGEQHSRRFFSLQSIISATSFFSYCARGPLFYSVGDFFNPPAPVNAKAIGNIFNLTAPADAA